MNVVPRIATLQEYYAVPAVRARMLEYCGGVDGGPPTCLFVSGLSARDRPVITWGRAPLSPVSELDALCCDDADVARSLWDSSSLLIHLDLDYQNTDSPGEAYHHPAEVFHKLEPVYRAVRHVLGRFEMPLLTLMTGRGYHFTGRVPLDAGVIDRLAGLVPEPPAWLATLPARRPPWVASDITERHAKAYIGAGLLVEWFAHLILRRARRRSPIPIVLNGTVVGSGPTGRECASLDLSYAGDPMDVRHLRVAFSAYQKHRLRPDLVGHGAASARAPFIAVPRGHESLEHLLSLGRTYSHAARAARGHSAVIPVVAAGVHRALNAYGRSRLSAFHRCFYGAPPHRRPEDGARILASLRDLPACASRPLELPNDRLLQPAFTQHVTRVLMADGLPPRDIAALVHGRYVADFGWGRRWAWLDPETRAEFDVRVFAGLVATGLDQALDFNCTSAQEKGLCPGEVCTHDLRVDRARLLEAGPT